MYKIFYLLQSIFKYFPFRLGIILRRFTYKPFFQEFGNGIVIHDNVIFKFPKEISLGNNIQIAQSTIFVGRGGLKIGNDVMIGAGTKIITSTHNHDKTEISMRDQGLSFKPINIKDDVWFGFNVIVLGGVNIGQGVIIGANSVVNKDVNDFSIIAGNPAKLIRKRKEV